jgi:TetR/AcrR family transcriptional regulator, transcriptional repressor for nem operon
VRRPPCSLRNPSEGHNLPSVPTFGSTHPSSTCILVGMSVVRKRLRATQASSRNPERTRGLLLQAAYQEIYRSGYRSADLDAILAAAGVTKGALYYHFDNKDALGYAVVDEVIATNLRQKWVQPLRNAKDPIDVLVRIIQSESVKREDVRRGCPLLNLSQEMSGIDEGFRKRTAKAFEDWHDAVAEALREGQQRGVVRSDIDASETATFLIATWEGYVVLGKNSQDPRTMQSGQRRMSGQIESLRAGQGRTTDSVTRGRRRPRQSRIPRAI